jgi:hypothetical protein
MSLRIADKTKRKHVHTQCTDMQRAIAFARILLGKISGKRRPGTGPAPRENDKTNLKIVIQSISFFLSGNYSVNFITEIRITSSSVYWKKIKASLTKACHQQRKLQFQN